MSSPASTFQVDWTEFPSESFTDRQKIEDPHNMAVPCRACSQIFRRVRLTFRFCAKCGHAFCEGEHLNFLLTGRGSIGRCIFCGPSIKTVP